MIKSRKNAFLVTLIVIVLTVLALDVLLLGLVFLTAMYFGFASDEVDLVARLFAITAPAIVLAGLVIATRQFYLCWQAPPNLQIPCWACGYDLRGNPEATECPECGADTRPEPDVADATDDPIQIVPTPLGHEYHMNKPDY